MNTLIIDDQFTEPTTSDEAEKQPRAAPIAESEHSTISSDSPLKSISSKDDEILPPDADTTADEHSSLDGSPAKVSQYVFDTISVADTDIATANDAPLATPENSTVDDSPVKSSKNTHDAEPITLETDASARVLSGSSDRTAECASAEINVEPGDKMAHVAIETYAPETASVASAPKTDLAAETSPRSVESCQIGIEAAEMNVAHATQSLTLPSDKTSDELDISQQCPTELLATTANSDFMQTYAIEADRLVESITIGDATLIVDKDVSKNEVLTCNQDNQPTATFCTDIFTDTDEVGEYLFSTAIDAVDTGTYSTQLERGVDESETATALQTPRELTESAVESQVADSRHETQLDTGAELPTPPTQSVESQRVITPVAASADILIATDELACNDATKIDTQPLIESNAYESETDLIATVQQQTLQADQVRHSFLIDEGDLCAADTAIYRDGRDDEVPRYADTAIESQPIEPVAQLAASLTRTPVHHHRPEVHAPLTAVEREFVAGSLSSLGDDIIEDLENVQRPHAEHEHVRDVEEVRSDVEIDKPIAEAVEKLDARYSDAPDETKLTEPTDEPQFEATILPAIVTTTDETCTAAPVIEVNTQEFIDCCQRAESDFIDQTEHLAEAKAIRDPSDATMVIKDIETHVLGDEIEFTERTRPHRGDSDFKSYFCRVLRASMPLQALMILLIGAASLIPTTEQDYCCEIANNLYRSLEPMLSFPNGLPV